MKSPSEHFTIPLFRPDLSNEEINAVAAVFNSNWLGPGPECEEFENSFTNITGATYAISTNSGTSSLAATLASLGIGPGDEIIIPSFTFISQYQVIKQLGATPVFADIEPQFLTLDPRDVVNTITPKTKGILTVHHGGQLSDIKGLSEIAEQANLWLIDDAAHAIGAKNEKEQPCGSLCLATCFSFGPIKNMTTGDGGMVTTSDPELAKEIAIYRSLGQDKDTWSRYGNGTETQPNRWAYDIKQGQRLHMNDIAAAIGLVQLRRLPELIKRRETLVKNYENTFKDISGFRSIKARAHTAPSWHMYTVLMEERDRFIDSMRERGITVGVHYYPTHLYPICKPHFRKLPVTEEIWNKVTTFPLYTTMTEKEQSYVIDNTRELAANPY